MGPLLIAAGRRQGEGGEALWVRECSPEPKSRPMRTRPADDSRASRQQTKPCPTLLYR